MTDEKWRQLAYCKDMDTDLFFPELAAKGAKKIIEQAKSYCGLCPVSSECLLYAIQANEEHGIWGGLLPKERNQIKLQYSVITRDIANVIVRKNVNNKVQS